jgi:hypothetical protein
VIEQMFRPGDFGLSKRNVSASMLRGTMRLAESALYQELKIAISRAVQCQ